MITAEERSRYQATSRFMREKMLDISYRCNISTHLGGGLSLVEIMTILYERVLQLDSRNPRWEDRDRFILSKGHGVLAYFAALLHRGFISEQVFNTFQNNESDLIAHPVMNLDLGIESSNGSLGHGLSMAIGISLAALKKRKTFGTYVLLGDGECNEGSVWEAIMFAGQLKLPNLVAIVDYNKLQSDGDSRKVIDFRDLAGKFSSFGWKAREVDGHDFDQLAAGLCLSAERTGPTAIIANTIKGKGVSFMENNNEWHHNRLTKTSYELAIQEVLNRDA